MRALLPALFVTGCAVASGDTRPASNEAPVVLELFTSQGCSSCPPADELLSKLARAGREGGRPVAALAFHVDYWNDLGWADPFSSPAWTQRQQAYARALGDDRVYTPELVVAGQTGMVGSQAGRVASAIAAAPTQLAIPATATWTASQVAIEATAPDGADVWVAVWEDAPRTKVTRGENAGELLVADRVVRAFEHVAAAGHTGKITIPLGSFHASGAIAIAQRTDRRIVGARVLPR